jgi:phage terminase large subunit-like protein
MNEELIRLAQARLRELSLSEAFDAFDLDSRPNAKQLEILKDASVIQHRWVVAGNQAGKSALAGRDLSWFINNEHPYFKRPEKWGTEPILAIVAGQSRQMMEVELWGKKIKPFLKAEEWKEKRVGGQIVSVVNSRTKDMIMFLSHADGSEKNRKYLQGFVAHYVWMDEMPSDIKILEELMQRVASKRGLFLATFTPKVRNDRIKKFVDSVEAPTGRKYSLSKIDNPIYADRISEEMQKLKGLSQNEINTILYGDWAAGDTSVYHFDYKTMVARPEGYDKGWRHVEASDPAANSKFGFTLWAQDPVTNVWYCMKSLYLSGVANPAKLVEEVIRLTKDVNIVRRVCDPHEPWYLQMAIEKGLHYVCPNKNNRKEELIKGLQTALSEGHIKITPYATDLIDEFQTCQWSDKGTIVNARSYHTLDTAQYFVDCMPKELTKADNRSWAQRQLDGHYARKKREAMKVGKSGRSKWAVTNQGVWRLR